MDLTQVVLSAVAVVGGSFSLLIGGSYLAYKMKKNSNK